MSIASLFRFASNCRWIWHDKADRARHNFVRFRRDFMVEGEVDHATLQMTADSRCELFVNGTWLGHGPIRSWDEPWPVDEYDLRDLLVRGRNILGVQAHDFGRGTDQYLLGEPGLVAQLDWADEGGSHHVVTDNAWRAAVNRAYAWPTPDTTVFSLPEEQYDARCDQADGLDWRELNYDDRLWHAAEVSRCVGVSPHGTFEKRSVPMLRREPVMPTRVMSTEVVRPADEIVSLRLDDCF